MEEMSCYYRQLVAYENRGKERGAYLLGRIHASESASLAGLAALLADVLHLFARAVGEVSGIGVVGHFVV